MIRVILMFMSLLIILSDKGDAFFLNGAGGTPGSSSACSDPIPAPAVTWNFTNEVFCINDISQIDVNNTGAPGFRLYTRIGWPGLASGNTGTQSQAATPASWFSSPSGGGFQILTTGTSGNPGIDLESCITNGTAGQWIGTTFSGSMYVKMLVGSAPSGTGADTWWVVGPWFEPTEYLAAASPGPANFTELDVSEFLQADGTWTSNVIGWQPSPTWNTPVHTFVDPFQRDRGGTSSSNPNHVNQTYGTLVVSPALNGGTGLIQGYFSPDLSTPETLNSVGTNTINFAPSDQIAQILTQHNCMAFSSGSGQVDVIRSVQVWTP